MVIPLIFVALASILGTLGPLAEASTTASIPLTSLGPKGPESPSLEALPKAYFDCLHTLQLWGVFQGTMVICMPNERPKNCSVQDWMIVADTFHGPICNGQSFHLPPVPDSSTTSGSTHSNSSSTAHPSASSSGSSSTKESTTSTTVSSSSSTITTSTKGKDTTESKPTYPLMNCKTDSDCPEHMNICFQTITRLVCAPSNKTCQTSKDCPPVGHISSGLLGASCDSNKCKYTKHIIIHH